MRRLLLDVTCEASAEVRPKPQGTLPEVVAAGTEVVLLWDERILRTNLVITQRDPFPCHTFACDVRFVLVCGFPLPPLPLSWCVDSMSTPLVLAMSLAFDLLDLCDAVRPQPIADGVQNKKT